MEHREEVEHQREETEFKEGVDRNEEQEAEVLEEEQAEEVVVVRQGEPRRICPRGIVWISCPCAVPVTAPKDAATPRTMRLRW